MNTMDFVTLKEAMKVRLDDALPPYPSFFEGVRRAPGRGVSLSPEQSETALKNALRYIPPHLHQQLAPEFMEELSTYGRIYAYRYRPEGPIRGKSIDEYRGRCLEAKALQVMIDNNLDFDVALYPYELVTYGESGQVFQNWLQYRLVKKYLEILESDQTLVIHSGHPLGIFKSFPHTPRVINTNGLMVGTYDNFPDWEVAASMGVTNYGQMTAGGWFFIGPQGIIHGCFNMLLNAARKAQVGAQDDLRGVLYVTAGIGSISSAQGKAAQIAGCVAIIAEVNNSMNRSETEERMARFRIRRSLSRHGQSARSSSEKRSSRRGVSRKHRGSSGISHTPRYHPPHSLRPDIMSYSVQRRLHPPRAFVR